jgi:Tfp pilus assembly protein PilO
MSLLRALRRGLVGGLALCLLVWLPGQLLLLSEINSRSANAPAWARIAAAGSTWVIGFWPLVLLVGVCAAILESAVRRSTLRSRAGWDELAFAMLLLSAGLFLFVQSLRYHATRSQLEAKAADLERQARPLEAINRNLEEFRRRASQLDQQWQVLMRFLPGLPETRRVEDELRVVARDAGVRVVAIEMTERDLAEYGELTVTMGVEAPRQAVEGLVSRITTLQRVYRIDDIFLPGSGGAIRLRAFFLRDKPSDPRPTAPSASATDPYPEWLFPLDKERLRVREVERRLNELRDLQMHVDNFQMMEQVLMRKVRLIERLRATSVPAIETVMRPERLRAVDLQIRQFATHEQAHVARTASLYGDVDLRAGDELGDGIVSTPRRW